jgi:hypothetical protein
VLLLATVFLGILAGAVSAFTGNDYMTATYAEYLMYPVLVASLMVVVGLITWLLPEGFSEEFIWLAKTGGYPWN